MTGWPDSRWPRASKLAMADQPLVGVIMGSKSDWETMSHAAQVLKDFDVPHECRIDRKSVV